MKRRNEIKKWMIDTEGKCTQAKIARMAGVSEAFVSMVIKGVRKSEEVSDALRECGCPERLLTDQDHSNIAGESLQ